MNALRVYLAGPRVDHAEMLDLRDRLAMFGIDVVSTWPLLQTQEAVPGPKHRERALAMLAMRDEEMDMADALLAIAWPPSQALCEAAKAIGERLAVVWVGERLPQSYRPGVVWVPSLSLGIDVLRGWAGSMASVPPGQRRRLLFQLAVDHADPDSAAQGVL